MLLCELFLLGALLKPCFASRLTNCSAKSKCSQQLVSKNLAWRGKLLPECASIFCIPAVISWPCPLICFSLPPHCFVRLICPCGTFPTRPRMQPAESPNLMDFSCGDALCFSRRIRMRVVPQLSNHSTPRGLLCSLLCGRAEKVVFNIT